jgi:hypothetical protein
LDEREGEAECESGVSANISKQFTCCGQAVGCRDGECLRAQAWVQAPELWKHPPLADLIRLAGQIRQAFRRVGNNALDELDTIDKYL